MKGMLKRILLKVTSTKFLIAVWAMIMVSILIIQKEASNNVALASILAGIPIAYSGLNVIQKKKQDE